MTYIYIRKKTDCLQKRGERFAHASKRIYFFTNVKVWSRYKYIFYI